jgi:hypothetical protein
MRYIFSTRRDLLSAHYNGGISAELQNLMKETLLEL